MYLLPGWNSAGADEIRVLNWQGYGTDEPWALEIFKEKTGLDVVHDNFNSEQEMLTKLRTNPGVYDVVLINSAFTRQAIEEELIQPIDTSKISHFNDLAPRLRDSEYLNNDGKVYGIAWVWGITSFAINSEVVDPPPASIQALWDEKYAGRIGWRDDPVEAVQMAALATGQDMNNPSDLDAIRQKLRELKPQIKTFWSSEDEWNKYLAAKQFDMAVYWSGSAARSRKAFNLPVTFVVPKEGAIGWFDGLSIPTGAPGELDHRPTTGRGCRPRTATECRRCCPTSSGSSPDSPRRCRSRRPAPPAELWRPRGTRCPARHICRSIRCHAESYRK
jgi:spermidine/putrescine transport system substrate-binding protein